MIKSYETVDTFEDIAMNCFSFHYMDKRFYALIAFFVSFLPFFASSQNYVWAKGEGGIGNDNASAITVDEQGNSYITGNLAGKINFSGTEYEGKGVFDVFITKYDASGNIGWVKTAGGPENDMGKAIKYHNGALYLAGVFEDTAYFENTMFLSKGEADLFVAKYDMDGNLVWVKQAGGTQNDYLSGMDVDDDGNIVIVGNYESSISFDTTIRNTNNIFGESYIAKYSNNGDVVWAKSVTGTNTNLTTDITYDNNGNYLITGFFSGNYNLGGSSISSSTQSYDILIGKLDKNGNTVWLKKAGSIAEDAAQAICADKDGNAFITGYFIRTAYFDNNSIDYYDYNDIFIAKYAPDGTNQWARAGKGSQLDGGFGISTDNEGNVYGTGMFMFTLDFDGWQRTSSSGRDIYVVSYSPNGNVRWLTSAGGVNTDAGLDLAVKPNGNITLCGYYLNTCNFGNIEIDYAEYNDLFIAEFNPPFVTGIDHIKELHVKVFPNPVKDVLNIETEEGFLVSISNAMGQEVYSGNNTKSIDASTWESGIYIIQVTTTLGNTTRRFTKQ